MESEKLSQKKCIPCEGGVAPLSAEQAKSFLGQVQGWALKDKTIEKLFQFKDFVKAMAFVNRMADVAEAEGHHPDIAIHYNKVTVSIWTHAIGGLSENDFILAAKIDAIQE